MLSGCQQEPDQHPSVNPETESESDSTPIPWRDLKEHDKGRFFAALYYLPVTGNLYANRSRWAGYQPAGFAQQLDPPEMETLFESFIDMVSELNPGERRTLADQIKLWGIYEKILSQIESGHSTEEALAVYWEIEDFRALFLPSFESRNIDPAQWDPLDLVATLSSAEVSNIRMNIIAEMTLMEHKEALVMLSLLLEKLQ
jgi:hypothetical protein